MQAVHNAKIKNTLGLQFTQIKAIKESGDKLNSYVRGEFNYIRDDFRKEMIKDLVQVLGFGPSLYVQQQQPNIPTNSMNIY